MTNEIEPSDPPTFDPPAPRVVAITGSRGLVGTALSQALAHYGSTVRRVVRGAPSDPSQIRWDPEGGVLDPSDLTGVDAVVNLAGEPIGARRWSESQKQRIVESRVIGTTTLVEAIAQLGSSSRPVLVNASAIGFYGDRGDEVLTEQSAQGHGFLPDLVRRWEAAANALADRGTAPRIARFGIIMSPAGGALNKMLPAFRFGLGGVAGSGNQYMSWVALPDVIRALLFLLDSPTGGTFNVTAPNPVTNRQFSQTLGHVLGRPVTKIPMIGPRLLYGTELANSLLLESQRVLPEELESQGFSFQHTALEPMLRTMLVK